MIKKTTKILTLLLAGLLIISSMGALSVSATTAPTITLGSAEVEAGDDYATVSLPLNFEGKLTLTSIMVAINYDAGVEFVSAVAGGALSVGTTILTPNASTVNPVRLTWMPADYVNGNEISSGTLATFTFKVPNTAAKDFNFTVDVEEIYDVADDISSTFEAVNGKVTVKAAAPAAAPTITLGSAEVEAGDDFATVSLPLNFEGKLTLTSIMVAINYDAGVEFVSAVAGGALSVGTTILTPNASTVNPVRLTWMPADYVNGNEISSGTLATFTFKVPNTAAKDFNFTVDVEEIYDVADDISSTFKAVDGKVTVKAPAVPAAPTITLGSAEVEAGSDYATVSLPLNFEGKLTLTSIMVAINYDAGVEFVSAVAGGALSVGTTILTPNASTVNPVRLTWMPADYVNGNEISSGTLATFTFKVPNTAAKDFNFTVDVEEIYDVSEDISSTFAAVDGKVTVKGAAVTGPVVTFTNASGATVDDVVAGTMNMSVAMNGDASDLVMFAIYTKEGDYAVLKYQTNATIANGTATAQLQNIVLESGKNYYAKAFIWDADTFYGSVVTLGE